MAAASPSASDPFATLGIEARYEVDADEVERRYRELAKVLHPDRHAHEGAAARRLSLGKAVGLNEAYRVVRDDVARAKALLELRGRAVSESGRSQDPEFLMRVMELRESLGDARAARDQKKIASLTTEVQGLAAAARARIGKALDADADLTSAESALAELRYYRRFLDEVDLALDDAEG